MSTNIKANEENDQARYRSVKGNGQMVKYTI